MPSQENVILTIDTDTKLRRQFAAARRISDHSDILLRVMVSDSCIVAFHIVGQGKSAR
jgi:hypothetical protein